MKEYTGELIAENYKFGIVVSRFNSLSTDRLLEGAVDALVRSGASEDSIEILRVPGAFEIPLAAKRMALSKKYDAIICLGTVIRGETPHFDYVSAEVTKGIAQVTLDSLIPVAYGIVTADTTDQAMERSGNKVGNKGFDAAKTIIEMLNVMRNAQI